MKDGEQPYTYTCMICWEQFPWCHGACDELDELISGCKTGSNGCAGLCDDCWGAVGDGAEATVIAPDGFGDVRDVRREPHYGASSGGIFGSLGGCAPILGTLVELNDGSVVGVRFKGTL